MVLQPQAVDQVPHALRPRTHVVYQSAQPLKPVAAVQQRSFDVACVGHLRAVKDPLRAAIDRLDTELKTAIYAYYLEDTGIDELVGLLDLRTESIADRLRRARGILRVQGVLADGHRDPKQEEA